MRWFEHGALGVLLLTVFCTNHVKGDDTSNRIEVDRYDLQNACTELLRKQVNMEIHASLVYMQMAAHFGRNSVARKGFADFFEKCSLEERTHAKKLIDFLNRRGSYVVNFAVKMPKTSYWSSALSAITDALILEKNVNNMLNTLHDVAEDQCKDANLMDFLEREYLEEQVKSIDVLLRFQAILDPMKDDVLSEYLFDKQLFELGDLYFDKDKEYETLRGEGKMKDSLASQMLLSKDHGRHRRWPSY